MIDAGTQRRGEMPGPRRLDLPLLPTGQGERHYLERFMGAFGAEWNGTAIVVAPTGHPPPGAKTRRDCAAALAYAPRSCGRWFHALRVRRHVRQHRHKLRQKTLPQSIKFGQSCHGRIPLAIPFQADQLTRQFMDFAVVRPQGCDSQVMLLG